jgi:hypothetical protein
LIAGRQLNPSFAQALCWYRGDQGITLASGLVSQWNDLSGSANHVLQATPANQPPYGTINGRPAVGTFGPPGGPINLTSAVIPNLSLPFTAFIVFQRTDVTNSKTTVLCSLAASNPQIYNTSNAGGADTQHNNLSGSTNLTGTAQCLLQPLQEDMVMGVLGADLWGNGALVASSQVNNGGVTHPSKICVGNQAGSSILSFGGLIGELIIYPFVLTGQQRAGIRAYQKNFWGTP